VGSIAKVEIRVLGAGQEVGRAAIAIRSGESKRYLLLDYGVNFNERDEPQLPLHIRPNDIAALVVTHAHLDHVGATPIFYTSARIPAIMTTLTKKLSEVMIKDFIKISGYYLPFDNTDLSTLLDNTIEVNYNEEVKIDNFKIKLLNAGHIPGSSMVYIEVDGVTILYTGDINTIDTRLVKRPELENIHADIVIIEGTYGNAIHPPRKQVEDEFIESINEVIENGGNVLIPAFSLGRSQEILSLLFERMSWANVFYDGMIRVINNILLSHPEFINRYDLLANALSKFKLVRGSSDRKRIVKGSENIVVSSAGMLKGGPAVYYVKKLMDDPNNAIFLVSFQGPSTPGRSLLEDGVIGEGRELIKARIQWFDFSSHAGSDGLLWTIKNIKDVSKVVIIHSQPNSALALKNSLSDYIDGDSIYIPSNGDKLILNV